MEKYDDLEKLETALNKALQNRLPNHLNRTTKKIAIDFNLIPYYGEPSASELPFIYRSQAKNGTCSFYGYATLYVIKKGKRVTLAIKAIRRQDTKVAIITYLQYGTATFDVWVVCKYKKGKRRQKGIEFLAYNVLFTRCQQIK